mmetsp:Transcript_65002/g.123988  ORF Transcript_65002/g.123988 Transcript_65002/m.123988 type:complete len:471 (-) Transcript_65002:3-1415(-)
MADQPRKPNLFEIARRVCQKLDPDKTGEARKEIQPEELEDAMVECGVTLEESQMIISAANAANDDGSIRSSDFLKFLFRGAQEVKNARERTLGPALRFVVGTKVMCRTGPDEWSVGSIVALHYRESHWPPGKKVPYQVKLDEGPLIYVPMDKPELCRQFVPPWWDQLMEVVAAENSWDSPSSREALREASAGKDVNQRDHNGTRALHIAASANWLEGVDELIALKADVNMHDKTHSTALHRAVLLPSAQAMVQKLCAAGADLNLQDLNPEYDPEFSSTTYRDINPEIHRTPLHYSSEKGDVDTMRILTEHQADVNIQDGEMKTPLHLAIQEDHRTAIDLLLQSRADVHLSSLQSGMKNSPLMDAAHCNNHWLAERLIEARANVNQQGKSDMAAIHLAARRGDPKMVQILLSARADIEQESACGTALKLAKQKGGEELLQVLGVATPQPSTGPVSSVATLTAEQRAALFMD